MEVVEVNMTVLGDTFRARKVLVTGHTGFKGAWLTEWLRLLGARVTGFSLPPPTDPNLFDLLGLHRRIRHVEGDIRDPAALRRVVRSTRPDFVFHLAAQSLVRLSYAQPVETLVTNVLGTAHVLEAVRALNRRCAVIVVTSDKCYENRESVRGYRENDRLGGREPYSMSKACAELVTRSWRTSFFDGNSLVRVASVRAGNVIGGGDWAADRIVPDAIRALAKGRPVQVRNPQSRRPWQHVLEPLFGYLLLAARISREDADSDFCDAWNFGPAPRDARTVADLMDHVVAGWGGGRWVRRREKHPPHEAAMLALSSDKAARRLGWRPIWSFEQAVCETLEWYKTWAQKSCDLACYTDHQIEQYMAEAYDSGNHPVA